MAVKLGAARCCAARCCAARCCAARCCASLLRLEEAVMYIVRDPSTFFGLGHMWPRRVTN